MPSSRREFRTQKRRCLPELMHPQGGYIVSLKLLRRKRLQNLNDKTNAYLTHPGSHSGHDPEWEPIFILLYAHAAGNTILWK